MVIMLLCVLFSFVIDIVCLAYAWFIVWICWSKANGGVALLLTDGTMLMNECQVTLGTTRWWRLHPDANGSYFHGPWSRCADSHVARLYSGASSSAAANIRMRADPTSTTRPTAARSTTLSPTRGPRSTHRRTATARRGDTSATPPARRLPLGQWQ